MQRSEAQVLHPIRLNLEIIISFGNLDSGKGRLLLHANYSFNFKVELKRLDLNLLGWKFMLQAHHLLQRRKHPV